MTICLRFLHGSRENRRSLLRPIEMENFTNDRARFAVSRREREKKTREDPSSRGSMTYIRELAEIADIAYV